MQCTFIQNDCLIRQNECILLPAVDPSQRTLIEEMKLTFNSEDISFIYGVAVLENFV